jgi:hypothetical protein
LITDTVARVSDLLLDLYGDQLAVLGDDRCRHSVAVGSKAARAAGLVAPSVRADLVAAATLHDVGYGHVDTGFHPLDGARYLRGAGFSPTVCHLVIHHSASTLEADERGIDPAVFDDFRGDRDLGAAHSILWWADLTTGPDGQTITVEERLEEICGRYGPEDIVTRFISRARHILLKAGQSPAGSIQVPL